MNDAKSANRIRLLVIISLCGLLALVSFWLLQVIRNQEVGGAPQLGRNEPDYYVQKFVFVRMSKAGQPQYIISGDKLTHRPLNDSSEVLLPVVQSLSPDQPPVTIHAKRALVDQDSSKVQLLGNVDMERSASAKIESLRLKTEALLILPDDDLMQTDLPVEITMGKSVLTGTGMSANNGTREFRLSNQVHAIYRQPETAAH